MKLCLRYNICNAWFLDIGISTCSKAFNSVPHNELLMTLWSFGITDKLYTWFQLYLSNHHQFVSINNCSSDPLPVKSGVPQGSILGPLLFVIYISDLSSSIMYSDLFKFADDTKCYKAIHNFQDSQSLQLDVDSLFQWTLESKLSFNISKCVVVQFKPSINANFDTSYCIDNRELSKVREHHDLGVIFTENLSRHSHYEAIVCNTLKSLGLLKRTFKHTTSPQVRRTLYFTLVRPTLLYCSPLRRPFSNKKIYCYWRGSNVELPN